MTGKEDIFAKSLTLLYCLLGDIVNITKRLYSYDDFSWEDWRLIKKTEDMGEAVKTKSGQAAGAKRLGNSGSSSASASIVHRLYMYSVYARHSIERLSYKWSIILISVVQFARPTHANRTTFVSCFYGYHLLQVELMFRGAGTLIACGTCDLYARLTSIWRCTYSTLLKPYDRLR